MKGALQCYERKSVKRQQRDIDIAQGNALGSHDHDNPEALKGRVI